MQIRGKSHPVQDLIQELREIFLSLGFDEVENPIFIPEEDVYKQYGKEAAVVLDRCYYLAVLPRPDIGIKKDHIAEIRKISPKIDVEKLKTIFREYKEGKLEADDLVERLVIEFNISRKDAIKVLDLFPEFKEIKPIPTSLTLRSHMTAGWFLTLQAILPRSKLPLKLFSIGLRFRREQRLDKSHLRAHYGASCVIADKKLELEDCFKISKEILGRLGFKDIEFKKKASSSNYYEDCSEYEVFSRGLEIADCGFYAKRALRNYGIDVEVFNIGFGLERILMLKLGKEDVREILYPQFYSKFELSDKEIASQLSIAEKPKTKEAKELAKKIETVARKNSAMRSPCEFLAWKGKLFGKSIEVWVYEAEKDKLLLGPAALNEIYVYDGNIYGIPESGELREKLREVVENGIKVRFSFLEAISNYFAKVIEESLKEGKTEGEISIKMAKSYRDINVEIPENVLRYITSKQKEISLRGPIFMSVKFQLSEARLQNEG